MAPKGMVEFSEETWKGLWESVGAALSGSQRVRNPEWWHTLPDVTQPIRESEGLEPGGHTIFWLTRRCHICAHSAVGSGEQAGYPSVKGDTNRKCSGRGSSLVSRVGEM